MIHLSARFLGLLAVLSFASVNAPVSAGVALDVRHHSHHTDANDASGTMGQHHGAHSKHSTISQKKSAARPASTAKTVSTAPVAVKAVQLPLPPKMKAAQSHARAAPLLVQSDGLSYLPDSVDVSIHGGGDLVRVDDRVFSSRILGRRGINLFATRSPHHHDHDEDTYTKVIINGDNDRVRIHDDDRHHHHHGDDDYTKVIINGDNDRVRVHNRALEMQLGLVDGSPLVIAHVDRRGVVEVEGDNQTVGAKETTKLTGTIDIVSMVAGEAEKLGPRIASLFLNQATLSPDGASYPLDASTTNRTQVTIIAQAPIPGMEESLLKLGPHEVPVVMQIAVFDSKALQHTNWCATYDSRPSVATPLLAKPCATNGDNGGSHEDQRFLWNSQTQVMRPVFLPDAVLPAVKAKGAEGSSSASITTLSSTPSAVATHSENDFPTYEDGKEYNWPKPGEDPVDEEAEVDASPDVAKVAAYQSTYSKNSSRPPIMAAAAAVAAASSSSFTATEGSASRSTSLHEATPTPKAAARRRGVEEGKTVIMVFRPEVPIVGAQEVSSSLTSASAIPTSSSATSSDAISAKAAPLTTSGSATATETVSVTSSLAAADATSVSGSMSPTSSSVASSSDGLAAAQVPTSTESSSEVPSSTSSATTSGVSGLAAVEATSTEFESSSLLTASFTDSLASAAEATSSSSSDAVLTSSTLIGSSTALDAAEATITSSASDSTSTSTVTETHTMVGAKEATSSGVPSSNTASAAPTTTAAGVLDVKLVSDEASSSTHLSSSTSAMEPTPSATQ